MAWSEFDGLENFLGKNIRSIKHDYGEGKMCIAFEDGSEIMIRANYEAELEVVISDTITKSFIV